MKPADVLIVFVLYPLAVITAIFSSFAFVFYLCDEPKWQEFHTQIAVGCGIAAIFTVTLVACMWDEPAEYSGD